MPGYIPKLLQALQHPPPTITYHSPYLVPEIRYGQKVQIAITDDDAPLLDKKKNTLIRQIIYSIFFFIRILDLTLLLPTNELALQQINSTIVTLNLCT